jgi:hypothetical protein
VGVDAARSLSFDRAGRLVRASWSGRSVRRGLDSRFVEKRKTGRYAWSYARRELPAGERAALVETVREAVAGVRASLPAGGAEAARARLDTVLTWSAERLEAERKRFAAVYGPVPILPPDQYRALVVQVTEGCSYNRCAHCRFYRDRPFHAKTPAELAGHVAGVQRFFGQGLSLRRGVFLGDANALVLPPAWLHAAFDTLEAGLGAAPLSAGVAAFIDAFTGAPRGADHFSALARRGLRRVYLGLESGSDAVLDFLEKPAAAADAATLVARLKAAGLAVGVIVMLGVGGLPYAARHVAETRALLAALPLAAGDLLYLSPLAADPDSLYRRKEQAAGISPVGDAEMERQYETLRLPARSGVKSALYDIRDFLY